MRQNERLTGRSDGPKPASFDGRYVAEGLPHLYDGGVETRVKLDKGV